MEWLEIWLTLIAGIMAGAGGVILVVAIFDTGKTKAIKKSKGDHIMAEKKSMVRSSGDMVGLFTGAKAWVAAASVPLTTLIVYLIELAYTVKIPQEIKVALGTCLAALGTALTPNAKAVK